MEGRSQEHFEQDEPHTEAEAGHIRHSSVPPSRNEKRGREPSLESAAADGPSPEEYAQDLRRKAEEVADREVEHRTRPQQQEGE